MSDIKNSVEIALKIIGADTKSITAVQTAFEGVSKQVKDANLKIAEFKTAIESIKAPAKLNTLVKNFQALEAIKPPNIAAFTNNLVKLNGIVLPNLTSFVTQTTKLSGITIPSLAAFQKSLAELSKITTLPSLSPFVTSVAKLAAIEIPNNLNKLMTTLKEFKGLKLPDLVNIATGFEKLSAIEKKLGVQNLSAFETELKKFAGIKLPNFAQIATGFERLAALKAVGVPNLEKFVTQVSAFSAIKLPNFAQIATGFDKLSALQKIGVPNLADFVTQVSSFSKIKLPNFAQIATGFDKLAALKKVEVPNLEAFVAEVRKFSGIKLPSFTQIATGFDKLAALKKIGVPDLEKFVAQLTSFTKVKLPSFGQIATGFDKLAALKKIGVPNLDLFVAELNKFAKVKLPQFAQIATGFDKLAKMGTPPSLAKFITELDGFTKVKVPTISKISVGLVQLGTATIDMDKAATRLTKLKTALTGFTEIKVPNLNALVSGLVKITKLDMTKVVDGIKALNDALAKLDKAGGIDAFKKFASDVGKLKSVFDSAAKSIDKNTAAVDKANKSAKEAKTGFAALYEKLQSFKTKLEMVGTFRAISDALVLIKDSFTGGLSAITDYDQAMKDLQAITGATDSEIGAMGQTILDIASDTKFSADEVATGMKIIGQAGFTASESINTMKAVANLATGTLSDMSTSVDLVTTAMRIYHIDASESTRVSDVFANAVNGSKLTIDKLRTALNYVGPIARDSGVSFEELSAAMGTLANSGLRASSMGTGLRQVLAAIVDPSKKLVAAADNAGVALSDLDPTSNSLSSVIKNLNLVIDDSAVAFDVFGKRGASAALALVNSESGFDNMLTLVGRQGTAAKQAAIQMEGLGVSFKNLKDKLANLAIALGDSGLASAMKVLIDGARVLVDAFIAVVSSKVGSFFLALTGSVSVVAAATAAFYTGVILLNKAIAWYTAETAIAMASTSALSVAIDTATAAVSTLYTTIMANPIVAVIAAIGAALVIGTIAAVEYVSSLQKTAAELEAIAGEYKTLTKQFDTYSKNVSTMIEGSDKLVNANRELRTSLFEIADEYDELAPAALAAANSINAVNGEVTDGNVALDSYRKILESLELKTLIESGVAINEAYAPNINILGEMVMGIDNLVFAGVSWANKFIPILDDSYESARDFTQGIQLGQKSVEDLDKYTLKLAGMTNLNEMQKKIVDDYADLSEQAGKALNFLKETGQISLQSTSTEIEIVAKAAGFSGMRLEAMVFQMDEMRKKNDELDNFDNIVEKWAVDGTDAIAGQIDAYKALGLEISVEEEAEIRAQKTSMDGHVAALAAIKKELDDKVAADIAAGLSKDEIAANYEISYREYKKAEVAILADADKTKIELINNTAAQNIKAINKIKDAYAKKLKEIDAEYKKYDKNNTIMIAARVREEEEALAAMEVAQAKYTSGKGISDKEAAAIYKTSLQEIKTAHAEHINDLAVQESKGLITSEEFSRLKLYDNVEMYKELLVAAENHADDMEKLGDPVKYEKANAAQLKAAEDLSKAKQAVVIAHNKEVVKLNKKIEKDEDKLAAKILSINEKLAKKLKKIDQDIADNKKELKADLLALESGTEEKIRLIKQKSMTDAQKQADDEKAAQKYLMEGLELIAQARRDNDLEALAQGQSLIDQSESIGGSLDSETKAVDFLNKALEASKKARNAEAQIKEIELITKKTETQKDAEADITKFTKSYGEKIKIAKETKAEIEKLEKERQATEIDGIAAAAIIQEESGAARIEKSKEALQIEKEIAEIRKKAADYVANGGVPNEKELKYIEASIKALQEKHDLIMRDLETEQKAATAKFDKATEDAATFITAYKTGLLEITEAEYLATLEIKTDAIEAAKTELQTLNDLEIKKTIMLDAMASPVGSVSEVVERVINKLKTIGEDIPVTIKFNNPDIPENVSTLRDMEINPDINLSEVKTGIDSFWDFIDPIVAMINYEVPELPEPLQNVIDLAKEAVKAVVEYDVPELPESIKQIIDLTKEDIQAVIEYEVPLTPASLQNVIDLADNVVTAVVEYDVPDLPAPLQKVVKLVSDVIIMNVKVEVDNSVVPAVTEEINKLDTAIDEVHTNASEMIKALQDDMTTVSNGVIDIQTDNTDLDETQTQLGEIKDTEIAPKVSSQTTSMLDSLKSQLDGVDEMYVSIKDGAAHITNTPTRTTMDDTEIHETLTNLEQVDGTEVAIKPQIDSQSAADVAEFWKEAVEEPEPVKINVNTEDLAAAKGINKELHEDLIRVFGETYRASLSADDSEAVITIDGVDKKLKDLTATEWLAVVSAKVSGEKETDALRASIDKLQDKTVTITTVHRTVNETVEKAQGGKIEEPVFARTGKRIPGFGGGDIVPAQLEPGEWVIRKEAVAKYGDGFFQQLNQGQKPQFATGGEVTQEMLDAIPESTGTIYNQTDIDAIWAAGKDLAQLRGNMHPTQNFYKYHIIPDRDEVVDSLDGKTKTKQGYVITAWDTFLAGEGGEMKPGASILNMYRKYARAFSISMGGLPHQNYADFNYFNGVYNVDGAKRVSDFNAHMNSLGSDEKAEGGRIEDRLHARTGKRIPGFGGGDIVSAQLEPGEWVIRKEAVKKYGDGFMEQLNQGIKPQFASGGSPRKKVDAMIEPGEWVMGRETVNKFGDGFMNAINTGTLESKKKFATGGPVQKLALGGVASSASGDSSGLGTVSSSIFDTKEMLEELRDLKEDYRDDQRAASKDYYSDSADMYSDYVDSITDLEESKGESLLALTDSSNEAVQDLIDNYAEQILDSEEDYNDAIADVERDHGRSIVDIEENRLDTIADMNKSYSRSLVDVEESRVDALEDIAESYADSSADLEESRLDSIKDLNENYSDSLGDLEESRLDSIKDLNENYSDARSDAHENHLESLENLDESYTDSVLSENESQIDALVALEESRADAITQIDEELLSKQKTIAGERAQIEEDLQSNLLSVNQSTADKLKAIQQRGLSETEKAEADKKQASIDMQNAVAQLNEAKGTGDVESIDAALTKLTELQDFYAEMDDAGTAAKGVSATGSYLAQGQEAKAEAQNILKDEEVKAAVSEADASKSGVNTDNEESKAALQAEHAEKLSTLAIEHTEALSNAEEVLKETLADLSEAHSEALADIAEENAEKLADLAEEKAEALADLEEENIKAKENLAEEKAEALADLEEENAEKLADMAEEKAESLSDMEEEHLESLADLEEAKAERLSDMAIEHAESLADGEEEHLEALANLDEELAESIANLDEEHAKALEDMAEEQDIKKANLAEERAESAQSIRDQYKLAQEAIAESFGRNYVSTHGYATGGFISEGAGGVDDVPAVLAKGEFVQKESAVSKYGRNVMEMLNKGLFPTDMFKKFNVGGFVSPLRNMPMIQKFSSGGAVAPASSTVLHSVDFNIGGKSFGPFQGEQNNIDSLINELSSAKGRA